MRGCLEIVIDKHQLIIEDGLNVERVLDSLNLDRIRATLYEPYHSGGPGRMPVDPLSMLKAQLTKCLA